MCMITFLSQKITSLNLKRALYDVIYNIVLTLADSVGIYKYTYKYLNIYILFPSCSCGQSLFFKLGSSSRGLGAGVLFCTLLHTNLRCCYWELLEPLA